MIGLLVCRSGALALGPLSIVGIALVTALLAWERSLVKHHDLPRVHAASFPVSRRVGGLVWLSGALALGPLSIVGIAVVTALLAWEHSLVKPHDLSRVNAAFFTVNGCVSVLFFLFWTADVLYAIRF